MDSLTVRLVDAFTNKAYGGNIAGVVPNALDLSDSDMQRVAAELAAPTTGFAQRLDSDQFRVRFFTPTQEIDMCGHVILGVCAVLALEGQLVRKPDRTWSAVAETSAGPIAAEISESGGRIGVMMQQNRPRILPAEVEVEEIAGLLDIGPEAIDDSLPLEIASTALRHLVIPVRDIQTLADLRPSFDGLADLSRRLGVETLPVFCQGSPTPDVAYRVRDLCPGIGNPEEAASGTTNGALTSYLYRHGILQPDAANQIQVRGEQGCEMGRPSLIETHLTIADDEVTEVRVGGSAIVSLRGEMQLPSQA
jgi:trans-2,3-dihydro-3-hydroxyanthranilate isomerase